ncbi:DUF6776 family protein [Pseudomonadota bacterium]
MVFRATSKTPKIVPPGSGWSPWWLLLIPVMVAAAAWAAYEYGRLQAGFDEVATQERILSLEDQVHELETERAELYQQMAALERSSQIDREAARTVRDEIKLMQDERLEMEEELVFLRGIVSNQSAGKGSLRIQELKLESVADKEVRYTFTVSHVLENLKLATGNIRISIDGVQDGKAISLPHKELAVDGVESLKMRFKHFQKVSGTARLPEGFVASSITVDIKPEGKKLSPLTQTFKWSLGG